MSGRVEENLKEKAGKNTTKWGRNIPLERRVGGKSQEKYQAVKNIRGVYPPSRSSFNTHTHTHIKSF